MQTIHGNGTRNTNGTQDNGTQNLAQSPRGGGGVRIVTPGAGSPGPAPHDLLTRLRDKWGNRLGWASVFSIPTVEDVPLAETALAPGLRVLEVQMPLRASTLHHFYDEKLRAALRRFRRVLAEETDRLAESNAFAAGRNAGIMTEQKALERERDAATLADRQALTALEDGPVAEAHADAAAKVAAAGGVYDPNDPSEASVLRHGRTALEVVAARLGLPGPHGDAHAHLPGWLGWAPEQAWNATPAEITEAYKGRRELLSAMFGSGSSNDNTITKPDEQTRSRLNAIGDLSVTTMAEVPCQ